MNVKENQQVSNVVVLALVGIPGAGKSTLARRIQDLSVTPHAADHSKASKTEPQQPKTEPQRETGSPWWCQHENCLESCVAFQSKAALQEHSQSYHQKGTFDAIKNLINTESESSTKGSSMSYAVRVLCVDDVVFDPLIHSDESTRLSVEAVEPNLGSWREQRRAILDTLESWIKEVPLLSTESSHSTKQDTTHIFIVDDNLYYSSMRYQLYQLVREYSVGYAQIHVECSLDTAIDRDGKRDRPIGESVIRRMASKLEPPSTRENKWETFSIAVKVDDSTPISVFDKICKLVESARKAPSMPAPRMDPALIAAARLETAASIRHQFDVATRKIMAQAMASATAKECGKKTELQQTGKKLNNLRKKLMSECMKKNADEVTSLIELFKREAGIN